MNRLRCFLANAVTSLMLGVTLVTSFSLVFLSGLSVIAFAPIMSPLLLASSVLMALTGFAVFMVWFKAWETVTWYEPPKRQVIKAIDGVPLDKWRRQRQHV